MADDCEPEIDVMGEFDLDLGTMSSSLEINGLQTNNVDMTGDISHNYWALDQAQSWYLDQGIDDKSRLTIEKMMQDERHYLGMNSSITSSPDVKLQNVSKKEVQSTKRKKPWSTEEKQLFVTGLELHGRRWSQISKYIGTRTTLQVKNFARKYLKHQSGSEKITKKSEQKYNPAQENAPEVVASVISEEPTSVFCSQSFESVDNVENCSLEPVSFVVAEEIVDISHKDGSEDEEEVNICDDSDVESCLTSNLLDTDNQIPSENVEEIKSEFENKYNFENDGEVEKESLVMKLEENFRDINCDDSMTISSQPLNEYDSITSANSEAMKISEFTDENKLFFLNPPTEEMKVDNDVISEEEKQIHKEFFESRPQKTPERIRTYIIESWRKCKPSYLNKTSVRPGLKNCGDVNCIGRIHQYLEQNKLDIINHNRFHLVPHQKNEYQKKKCPVVQCERRETMRPRKRKRPTFHDNYSLDEGYTVKYDSSGAIVDEIHFAEALKVKSNRSKVQNPFELISCVSFSKEQPEPFSVQVGLEAALVADVHSHSVHTEVMGLLGGKYDRENHVLQILTCEACESLSTGVQCEMDPVSQTIGMEALQNSGYEIVGWYHSHPTFVPDPSVRDIETQKRYQDLFESQGENPFIAMIISPFCPGTNTSIIRYLIIGYGNGGEIQTPYSFEAKFLSDNLDINKILLKAEQIFSVSSQCPFQVDMMSIFSRTPDVTYLDVGSEYGGYVQLKRTLMDPVEYKKVYVGLSIQIFGGRNI
ncbi:Histone H2A deubiquitinase MYSM1 [Nymphon striatum]|nr:Histone H2A deubiquitinase MYSM1 [Nymphon striatum]